jgi:signal transduction histidine kinase
MAQSLSLHLPRFRAPAVLTPRLASVVAAAGVAAAAITWVITTTGNDPSVGAAVVRASSVLLPTAVGLAIWTHPPSQRFGRLLVAGGFVTFLGALGGADDEVVYSVGRVASWLAEITLVYLVLAFPSGWLHSRIDRVLVAGVVLIVAVLFVPTVLVTDAYPVPATWTTCTEGCPGNAFQVTGEPGWVGDVVLPVREVLTSLLLLGVTLRLLTRIATATTTMRRTLTPVLGLAVVHAVALPLGFSLRRAGDASEAVLTVTWVLAVGVPVMALGFLVGAARWRLAVGAGLYRLAPKLQAGTDPETLRCALAEALDDPSIDLVYRSDGRWLDTHGEWVTLPAADSRRAYTVISDGGSQVAAILHDDALRDHRDFVHAVGGLALVVLTNQRLRAQVEKALQEARRSRERILAVADEERRRIERDLHDGAQQRLVALRIKLELASERSAQEHLPDAAQLHQLSEDVGDALDEVRSLAAGVYPALLVDCGLEEALRSAARRSPLPTSVAAQGVGRFPQQIEAAVYFCCLEALQNAAKHAEARSVSIVVLYGDDLRFEVRDDGRGFDVDHEVFGHGLTNIHDRLVAVGGTLVVESGAGRGTRIAGTIPLTTASRRLER